MKTPTVDLPRTKVRWTKSDPETPEVKLFNLTAEAQEHLPEHTYKAVMLRVSSRDSVEEKCELLADVVGEFKRGVAA